VWCNARQFHEDDLVERRGLSRNRHLSVRRRLTQRGAVQGTVPLHQGTARSTVALAVSRWDGWRWQGAVGRRDVGGVAQSDRRRGESLEF